MFRQERYGQVIATAVAAIATVGVVFISEQGSKQYTLGKVTTLSETKVVQACKICGILRFRHACKVNPGGP